MTSATAARPSPVEIRAALTRVLASRCFAQATRARDFLRFVGEQTLAGQGERLKGYTIALEVFGRPSDFDSQTDPLVRVEAGRLRQRLAEYYHDEGQSDPIEIELPRGSYVLEAHYARREPQPDTPPEPTLTAPTEGNKATAYSPTWWSQRLIASTLGAALAGVLMWYFERAEAPSAVGTPSSDTRPRIAVREFEPLGTDPATVRLAGIITEEVMLRLGAYSTLVVVDPTGAGDTPSPTTSYELSGTVRTDAGGARVTARLVSNDEQLWGYSYDLPPTAAQQIDAQAQISARIAAIAGAYGPIFVAEVAKARVATAAPRRSTYDCVLVYYTFRAAPTPTTLDDASDCFSAATQTAPAMADAWAGLALTHLDALTFRFNVEQIGSAPLVAAMDAVRGALEINQDSFLALLAAARLAYFVSADAFEARTERLLALYPDNPEGLAVLGGLLALSGDPRGLALADRAIELNPAAPGIFYLAHALTSMREGRAQEALDFARRFDTPNWYAAHLITAAAAALAGYPDEARLHIDRLLELYPEFQTEAPQFLAAWRAEPALRSQIVRGLTAAGLALELPQDSRAPELSSAER